MDRIAWFQHAMRVTKQDDHDALSVAWLLPSRNPIPRRRAFDRALFSASGGFRTPSDCR
jgi:hypothetical protein